jgi:hypothetical protein
MTRAEQHIPDDIHERIRLVKEAVEKKCSTLHVKSEEQHILITGASPLTRKERAALKELGIEHSKFHGKIYKESDEYRNAIKHFIKLGLLRPEETNPDS